MSRPTLFLDFDGVLHPERCASSQYFKNARLLVAWLAAHPDVDIVISSTWRSRYSLPELKGLLPQDLADRVRGVTPDIVHAQSIPDRLMGYPRHAECWLWQRENKDASDAWLALDDKPWLFYPLTPHLISCEGDQGITSVTVLTLDLALSRLKAL